MKFSVLKLEKLPAGNLFLVRKSCLILWKSLCKPVQGSLRIELVRHAMKDILRMGIQSQNWLCHTKEVPRSLMKQWQRFVFVRGIAPWLVTKVGLGLKRQSSKDFREDLRDTAHTLLYTMSGFKFWGYMQMLKALEQILWYLSYTPSLYLREKAAQGGEITCVQDPSRRKRRKNDGQVREWTRETPPSSSPRNVLCLPRLL